MDTAAFIWMDGVLKPWNDAQIHILTHSLHYGGAAFEGIRFYETDRGPAIFRLDEHLKRLFYSASTLEMMIPYSLDDLKEATLALIRQCGLKSGYIRPIVYYGYGKMGLYPVGAPVHVSIAVWPWGAYLGKDVVRVKISRFARIHPRSSITDAKISGHYVNSILPSLEAHKAGFDEAILLDFEGNVAEGPGENVFLVKEGRLVTPSPGNILPGITRDTVFTLALDFGIPYEEKVVSLNELKTADELFFTGTAAEITGIGQVDDVCIGSGTLGHLTAKIRNTYLDVVHGRMEKYRFWLTYV